jgi:hypothetical protein
MVKINRQTGSSQRARMQRPDVNGSELEWFVHASQASVTGGLVSHEFVYVIRSGPCHR